MDTSILKSFSPEIFLSMSILFQLVFNARFVNNLKYNYPVIDREVFFQTFFIVVCLILLLINLKIEGFLSNFLFLNDEGGKIIKIFVVVSSLLILNILMKAFSLQALNFFEFFTIFLLS
jgi:NADH:ubiquinone oxidoreductase subunit 2 (subunit N)